MKLFSEYKRFVFGNCERAQLAQWLQKSKA